jgi:hypothetical protein
MLVGDSFEPSRRLAFVGRNIRLSIRTGDAAKWSAPSLPQIAPVDPCAGGIARYRPSTGNGLKPMLLPRPIPDAGWSRPLPRPLTIPTVMKLRTPADVRTSAPSELTAKMCQ